MDYLKKVQQSFRLLDKITPNFMNQKTLQQKEYELLFYQMRFWNVMSEQEAELLRVIFSKMLNVETITEEYQQ